MALSLEVGEQVQIIMDTGVVTDYTFTSNSPAKAPVNNLGIVTANAAGEVVIVVKRNSDNKIVDRVRLTIIDPDDEDTDPGRPYATVTPL